MRPRRNENSTKAESATSKKVPVSKPNKSKNVKATLMDKKSKEAAPLSNGISEDHVETQSKQTQPLSENKMEVNGEVQSKERGAGRAARKRKGPKVPEEEEPRRPKVARSEQEGESSTVPRAEVPNRAIAKKQKVALELLSLPTASGVVFVIGDNTVGQLGLTEDVYGRKRPFKLDMPTQFVDIAAGGMHSVCLTEKGEVYTFGCNDEGALGRATEDEEGSEYIPKLTDVPGIVVKVTAGDSHSAALTTEGHVYLWGNFKNNEGFIGLTAYGVKQTFPVRILNDVQIVNIASGSEHLVCLSSEGVVYTCGSGENGQLGRIPERSCKGGGRKGFECLLVPDYVHLGYRRASLPVDAIWTGSYSTYVRAKESGAIYAFGLNNYNQSGYEDELTTCRPRKVDSFNQGAPWRHISGGQHHTLALDVLGKVYSLGRENYGRLGLGENSGEISVPTKISTIANEKCLDVSSGNCVSFSVTERGSVHSWGMGTNYQLGHGNDNDCHVPRLIEGELLNSWHVIKASGGGQHTLLLAKRKAISEEKGDAKETND